MTNRLNKFIYLVLKITCFKLESNIIITHSFVFEWLFILLIFIDINLSELHNFKYLFKLNCNLKLRYLIFLNICVKVYRIWIDTSFASIWDTIIIRVRVLKNQRLK